MRVVFGNRELFCALTQARLLRQRHGRWKVCENVWRNGSVHFVVNGISLSVWQAMATIAGGEVVQVPQYANGPLSLGERVRVRASLESCMKWVDRITAESALTLTLSRRERGP